MSEFSEKMSSQILLEFKVMSRIQDKKIFKLNGQSAYCI